MRSTVAAMGAALLLAGVGCSATRVVNTWQAPAAQQPPLHKVLVVAVSRDEGMRRTTEEDFASRLAEQGVQAYRSSQFVEHGADLNPDALKGLVQQTGVDAVLVTQLLGVEDRPVYAPSDLGWYGYYGGLWPPLYASGYYGYGYYGYEEVVNVSNELFSAQPGGKLLWSGLTETYDPSSPRQAVASVSKAVVKKLDKMGLI